ncbi:uncharacterized protein RJT20DRAFT_63625 [Scheffersomyces xylosifermentans]|uniref:uncharacterized protein n=1 Tax=Scheffersomyces xylosifermentans TaxID=1304137 RepID=UPI00315D0264
MEIASSKLGTYFVRWKLPKNIEMVNLNACSIKDLTPIGKLQKLKSFKASKSYKYGYTDKFETLVLVDSVTALEIEGFHLYKDEMYFPPNLQILSMPFIDIFDLKSLEIPKSVTKLGLKSSFVPFAQSDVSTTDPQIDLSNFEKLSSLELIHSKLTSCNSLVSARFLSSIRLILCTSLEDLRGIESLKILSSLYVIHCGGASSVPLHRTFFCNTKFPENLRDLVFVPNSSALASTSRDFLRSPEDYELVNEEPHLKVGKRFQLPKGLTDLSLEGPHLVIDDDLELPRTLQMPTFKDIGAANCLCNIANLSSLHTLSIHNARIETLDNSLLFQIEIG